MSHQSVIKLKVETEERQRILLFPSSVRKTARETPCILQGVFLMQFCNLTTQCTAPEPQWARTVILVNLLSSRQQSVVY